MSPDPEDSEPGAPRASGCTSVITVSFNSGALAATPASSRCSARPARSSCSSSTTARPTVPSALLRAACGRGPRVRVLEIGRNPASRARTTAPCEQASGECLLFLNPDCVMRPDTIARMRAVMDAHPEAGMAGCLMLNADGSEQAGMPARVADAREGVRARVPASARCAPAGSVRDRARPRLRPEGRPAAGQAGRGRRDLRRVHVRAPLGARAGRAARRGLLPPLRGPRLVRALPPRGLPRAVRAARHGRPRQGRQQPRTARCACCGTCTAG